MSSLSIKNRPQFLIPRHIMTFFIVMSSVLFFSSLISAKATLDDDVEEYPNQSYYEESLSTNEFLHKHSLSMVAAKVSWLVSMVDDAIDMTTRINADEHFEMLNRVIDAFRKSFVMTVNEFSASQGVPSGPFSLEIMKHFFDRQETHLKELIKKDTKISQSEFAQFLGKLHLVFDKLKDAYGIALENHVSINLFVLSFAAPFIDKIPSGILPRSMFSELLDLPSMVRNMVHETLEGPLTSDYAPMLKMVLNLAANYDWSSLTNQFHEEL